MKSQRELEKLRSFLLFYAVYLSETLLEQEQMWAGLDCVRKELIGWLWFAIG